MHEVRLSPCRIGQFTVTNRLFGTVRGRQRLPHRRRAVRLVVRIRRPVARRLPRHPRRGRRSLVAAGVRRRLAPPGGAAIGSGRTRRPPGRARLVGRCGGLLRLERHAAADRVGVGARRPRRRRAGLPLPLGRGARARRRAPHERVSGPLPGREHGRRRLRRDGSGGRLRAQRLRAVQHNRQRLGVVRRLVRPDLLRVISGAGPAGADGRQPPRHARRLLPLPRLLLFPLPGGRAQRQHAGRVGREHRVSRRRGRRSLRRG